MNSETEETEGKRTEGKRTEGKRTEGKEETLLSTDETLLISLQEKHIAYQNLSESEKLTIKVVRTIFL